MSDQPRDRAISVADAVLQLPSPRSADEAWHVLAELERLAGESRSANREAASEHASDPLTWLRPSTELARRGELTAARWTASNPYPWTDWDEAAAEALDRELGELDRLAAEVTSVAEFHTRAEQQHTATTGWPAFEPEPEARHRRSLGVWAPLGVVAALAGAAGVVVLVELPTSAPASGHAPVGPQRATTPAAGTEAEAVVTAPLPVAHAAPVSPVHAAPLPVAHAAPAAAPRHAAATHHSHSRHRASAPKAGGITGLEASLTAAAEQDAVRQVYAARHQAQRRESPGLQGLGW